MLRVLLGAGGRQQTDSTHVLMAMRTMNRLEQIHETVRAALNAMAAASAANHENRYPA
ncbi:hypothetical protein [Nonomuraea roseoviolacea]|uniref:Uncharacterized protein n=1 Tax=Nonomuraea roseoviolacea subsp. carminata TaxID=160689 RepID=A0ABT1JTB3_9ACTN|nr:hypothetical protein [Nonomuraea roseoviolacea]MCP2344960.1 hypothetical protein [Nonomuraea roseoviolacea subsp. carminata]